LTKSFTPTENVCRPSGPFGDDTESARRRHALQIKTRARDLGFDLVGITTARPPPHAAEFQQWLADHLHGEMAYMERNADKRVDPLQVLAQAQSIIVVGLNYYAARPVPSFAGETAARRTVEGRIARYASGSVDYHEVMGEKLRELARMVDGIWYVDTGPILERDLAQRAGIGFIGKHTNLISRRLGNWIFLGVVLTALELPADGPEREYCGTCHRCIDACPTGAIIAPYRLDARLCISYLTIELKGSIPVQLRSAIGDRIFGCDDCLEVCPWNRFARESPVREFRRRDLPPLSEFLSWDEAKFRQFFRGTPIYRIKRRGFLRNVCVALGNIGETSALPALRRALDDTEPLVREHAAWAIERVNERAANRAFPGNGIDFSAPSAPSVA
jgi:epoxyqueuosine reductase